MGPIDCPETSVIIYHYLLRNSSEARRSHVYKFLFPVQEPAVPFVNVPHNFDHFPFTDSKNIVAVGPDVSALSVPRLPNMTAMYLTFIT
jgi:hypothetical protein